MRLDSSKLVFILDKDGLPFVSMLYENRHSNMLVKEFILLPNNTITSTNRVGSSSGNDEIVLRDEGNLEDTATSPKRTSNGVDIGAKTVYTLNYDLTSELEKIDISDNLTFVGWENTTDFEGMSGRKLFRYPFEMDIRNPLEAGVN